MVVVGFEHLPGTELAAGSFTISRAENADLLAAIETAPLPDDESAHPIWAYFATQRGIGVSVAELCALADFDVADGPILGSVEVDYLAPLAVDTEYRVTGQAVGIDRKVGAKTGAFDLFAFRLALESPDGETVATVINTFILPRRELQ